MLESLQEILARQWSDLLARPSGPMSFRFVLQPLMAAIAAFRDGRADAHSGRSPYFWTVLTDAQARGPRVREAFAATSRIILLGLAMDTIYQIIAFRKFYPAEALIIAVVVPVIPYFLLRGPFQRFTLWWERSHPPKHKPELKR